MKSILSALISMTICCCPNLKADAEPASAPVVDAKLNSALERYISWTETRMLPAWYDLPDKIQDKMIVVVIFDVERDGNVSNIHVGTSCGDKAIDETAVRAVKLAIPLRPLPAGQERSITVGMTFRTTPLRIRTPSDTTDRPGKEILAKERKEKAILLTQEGKAACLLRKYDIAINKYRTAMELALPNFQKFISSLLVDALDKNAMVSISTDPADAATCLRQALILEPNTEFLSQHLDSCLTQQNIDPKSYAQRLSLAQDFAAKKDYDSALVEYTQASQLLKEANSSSPDVAQSISTAGEGINKMVASRHAKEDETKWRLFLAQHPNSVDAVIGLSDALEKQDDVAGATEVLQQANERIHDNGSITTQLKRLEGATKK